jgi:hypothetical protein
MKQSSVFTFKQSRGLLLVRWHHHLFLLVIIVHWNVVLILHFLALIPRKISFVSWAIEISFLVIYFLKLINEEISFRFLLGLKHELTLSMVVS